MFKKLIKKFKKPTRYFYFEAIKDGDKVRSYVIGEDPLLDLIKEFASTHGYKIDFTIREISKEDFTKNIDKYYYDGGF
jgi:hypothetical protein